MFPGAFIVKVSQVSYLDLLDRAAVLLAAPNRHSALVVPAAPSVRTQTLILKGGEVRVVRDPNRHLRSVRPPGSGAPSRTGP